MQPLFTEQEKLAETGGFSVSQDPTTWVTTIIENFLNKYPFLQNVPVTVSWHKDHKKGYGVGSLNLLDGAIPILIKDYQVSPLDVFMSPTVATPVNETILRQISLGNSSFSGLSHSRPKTTTDLFASEGSSLQMSPGEDGPSNAARRITRPAMKVASVLTDIQVTDSLALENLLQKIASFPDLVDALQTNHPTILQELAAKRPFTKKAALTEVLGALDIDRQLVYRDEMGNYRVKQASSKVDYTWDVRITQEEASELAPVMASKETRVKTASETTKQFQKLDIKPGNVGIFKTAEFETPVMEIYNFELVSETDPEISLPTPEGTFTYRPTSGSWSVAGVTKQASWDPAVEISGSEAPQKGEFGVFLTKKGALGPFECVSMIRDITKPGDWVIKLASFTDIYTGYPLQALKDEFQAKSENSWWIPGNAQWVPLDYKARGIQKQASSEYLKISCGYAGEEYNVIIPTSGHLERASFEGSGHNYVLDKTAEFGMEVTKLTETFGLEDTWISKDSVGLYNLHGSGFSGLEKRADLSLEDARWELLRHGGTEADLTHLQLMHKGSEMRPEGKIQAPIKLAEFEQAIEAQVNKTDEYVVDLGPLLKIAASLGGADSIDAVMALGLLQKKNVLQYVQVLPTYEIVLAEIAKLLVAARLGLSGLDPEPLKEAMDSLARVVIMLKEIESFSQGIK